MTSNGESFRVAVLQGDEKYRRFVKGTNNAVYEKLDMNGTPAGLGKTKQGNERERSGKCSFQPAATTSNRRADGESDCRSCSKRLEVCAQ